jgi:hypothetical protein
MQRRQFLAAAAAAPALLAGCTTAPGFTAPRGGVDGLLSGVQKYMGTNPDQTAASLGAMFGLAQNKLSPADFASLNTSLPGIGDLVTKGASLGGFSPASLTSMQSVYSAVSKLNVSPAQIGAMGSYVTNALSGAGATSSANMLSSLWR